MQGVGCRVQGAGCRVQGVGCRVYDLLVGSDLGLTLGAQLHLSLLLLRKMLDPLLLVVPRL